MKSTPDLRTTSLRDVIWALSREEKILVVSTISRLLSQIRQLDQSPIFTSVYDIAVSI